MAVPVGRLTKSGLLYEGSDWSSWKERVEAQLEHLLICLPPERRYYGDYTEVSGIKLVDLIRAQISPHLHPRIPTRLPRSRHGDEDKSQYARFMRCVRMVASPFRLMDLPAELRLVILSLVMPNKGETVWSFGADLPLRRKRFHPIAHSCRKLRMESLPLAWSQIRIAIGDYDTERLLERGSAKFASSILDFVKPLGHSGLQDLRNITFDFRVLKQGTRSTCTTFKLRLHYNATTKALEMKPLENVLFALTPRSAADLEAHIENISQICKALDQQGEALIVALTSRPDLWAIGTLQCERHPIR